MSLTVLGVFFLQFKSKYESNIILKKSQYTVMGSSVSQLPYWTPDKSANGEPEPEPTGDPGQLSYEMLLKISAVGGILGLDHLYLRSPITAILKFLVNISVGAVWWIYDLLHIVFNREIVEVFGLGIPGLGPQGIGAGCLITNDPHKTHMNFLLFGLALLFGGLFGAESFLAGDSEGGRMHMLCLLSIIGIPVAFLMWGRNMFSYIFNTEDVIKKHGCYFGKGPSTEKTTFLERLFGKAIGTAIKPFTAAVAGVGTSLDALSTVAHSGISAVQGVTDTITGLSDISGVVKATADTYQRDPAINALQEVDAAKQAEKDAKNKESSENFKKVKDDAEASSKANAEAKAKADAAAAAEAAQKATEACLGKPRPEGIQVGGMYTALLIGQSNVLPYAVIGTIVLLAVSGIILTYRRSKKNERNDSPPEPGVPREPPKESI